ncbi:hypothetical protein O5O45_21305 [Hahella aquimaris]|uniref:flotillin family protein n=1 Tax=Hahella sp. HNIBRBA332 TaxID=3015983 RepID=UPI00273A7D3E|nr:hypothetical protein [Hahella sp. HNIBRBA332]WLQ12266.1 hypothetical protein O5O45_21305 [Hahella sp. HNIBRBA332]
MEVEAGAVLGLLTIIGGIFLFLLGILALFKAFYKKVEQGQALIVNDMSTQPKVYFTGAMVLPVIHKAETMKISVITLEIDRRGKDGLICRDNLRADITVAFYLRVNETAEDVLKVAKAVGVSRASDRVAVNELFNAKFSEALKTVGKQMEFLGLFEDRIGFRDRIVQTIGNDLNGYVLEDVAIDYLEQTPKSSLDSSNILDSEGIKKITEITAQHNIHTNRLERDEELEIKRKNVATREAMLELERQQADAEAKQKREVESIQARETAETQKVREEERKKAEEARILTEEQLSIAEENKQRQVEIAVKNRERAVAIEHEKVEKARQLEMVNREREVELQRIAKEKELEEQRKVITLTISERISVEKKVAEEEERIKEVREVSMAEREKQVRILAAQAEADEQLVKQVKAAEAEKEKALFRAQEINTIAQAELEASSKKAEANKKEAEGIQAMEAASGLAQARVAEAKAAAYEREGQAKANAQKAEGLAKAEVIEAQAAANEKSGLADAKVLEEKLTAKARGDESIGMAKARAERELGATEAEIIRQKAKAEADGLVEKFNAMGNMSPEAREFEEFRMRMDAAIKEVMASIEANKSIATDQAQVLAQALQKSNIEIVGGGGEYFESFSKALAVGKAIDGVAGKSQAVQAALDKLLSITGKPSGDKPH